MTKNGRRPIPLFYLRSALFKYQIKYILYKTSCKIAFRQTGQTLWNSLLVELKLCKSLWNLLSRNSKPIYLQNPMIIDHRGTGVGPPFSNVNLFYFYESCTKPSRNGLSIREG